LKRFNSTKKCAVIDLFDPNITPIYANETITHIFNRRNDFGMWNCYLINEQQGTGTDFPTHPDIEANGGIKVIVTVEPNSHGEFL
jgi:hypothetical protein